MFNLSTGRLLDAGALPLLWEMMFAPCGMPDYFRDKFPFAMATRPEVMLGVGEEAVQVLPELAQNIVLTGRCQVPAQVLAGGVDLMINPWRHAVLAGSALPNGDCEVLPGLGHMLQHQAVDRIVQAVRTLDGGAAR